MPAWDRLGSGCFAKGRPPKEKADDEAGRFIAATKENKRILHFVQNDKMGGTKKGVPEWDAFWQTGMPACGRQVCAIPKKDGKG